MKHHLFLALLVLCVVPVQLRAQTVLRTQNVILVTIDGLRWQEVFGGADSLLVRDTRFATDTASLVGRYWVPDANQRRATLLPFFWSTIATEGQLYGNRALGSFAEVANPHRFSYPGYSELLVGFHDPSIDSNAKRPNPNRTVLEFINAQPAMRGRVAAFGSWDVFPYIINEDRSGIRVNAGFRPATGDPTPTERILNRLQEQVPSPWQDVRLDAFTHNYAIEYLARRRPRLLYVAYGETDDFAHDGRYDAYLRAATRTDGFIRELWEWAQSQDDYRDRTTLIITTDHGRGTGDDWTRHGARIDGAEDIWIAVLGPDSAPLGEQETRGRFALNQVAATIAALLGFEYENRLPVGPVLESVLNR